jgi:hypothetical protein
MALAAHVNMREEQCNIIPKQIRLKDVLDCNGFDLGDGAPGGPAGLFYTYPVSTALRRLQSFSLIQWWEDQKSYSMHALVHAWEKVRKHYGGVHR